MAEIKQRKEAQDALEASTEKLQKALDQNDWYLAYVSHELRNALATVLASSELLEHAQAPAKKAKYVSILQRSSGDLGGLLNSILDFSALEAGQLKLRSEPLIAQEIVRSAYLSFLPQAQRLGVSYQLEMEESERFEVLSDNHRLGQVLNNLISNAMKYASEGEISVELTRRGHYVEFAIADTGPGIPTELRKAIL